MEKNYPLVSIVTVNYNGLNYTRDLLKSLQTISYQNIEIFVVYNASAQSIEPLKIEFPLVTFILSEVNLGFAGGNNLAIKQSNGKYCLLLNNGTEVDPGFLERIFPISILTRRFKFLQQIDCYIANYLPKQFTCGFYTSWTKS